MTNIRGVLATLLLFSTIFTTKIAAQKTAIDNVKPVTESKWYVSLQYLGLTFHPGGGTYSENYPWRLDKDAYLVPQVGLTSNVDYQLNNRFFLRGGLGAYLDCALLPSFYAHVGFRWEAIKWGKHSFNGGFGPTFLLRGNWYNKIEGYRGGDFFDKRVTKDGQWQYRFVLYGGELEYLYRFNEKWQLQTSIIPGYPAVITMKVGARMKF